MGPNGDKKKEKETKKPTKKQAKKQTKKQIEKRGKEQFVTKEDVSKRLGRGAADKSWTITSLALAFMDKYGEKEALEILKKTGYGRGERNGPRIEKLMKEAGANFKDPRDVRRYLRENVGFWGYVEHTDDNVVVKPDGKVRVEYRITKCPWVDTWNEMGIPLGLQFKLDSCLGIQSDTASMKYFKIKYECDQGLTQGRDCCKFVLEKM